jgi:hypothetical protein
MMKLLTLLAGVVDALAASADVAATREDYNDAVGAAIEAQFAHQPPRPPGRRPEGLTAAERRELMAWLDEANGKGLVPVELTDPRELRMLDLLYKAVRRPPASKLLSALGGVDAIRAKLDRCSEFLKEHQTRGLFLDVGANSDGKLRASALQSAYIDANPADIGGFGTVLTVFDSVGTPVTDAAGKATNLQVTLLTQAPPRQGTNHAEDPPRAVSVFTTLMNDGTPCPARYVVRVLPPPKSIAATAPNNSQSRKTVLCLNRGDPQEGWPAPCDFGPFRQANFDGGWAVVVPLAGTIVMPYPLALKDGKIDAILTVTAINTQNGTPCTGQRNDLGPQVLAQSTVSGTDTIKWSILADNALIFGKTCFQPHNGLAFNMFWQAVKVNPPSGFPISVTAIISNTIEQGSANTLVVRNVDLQFGCVPVGTLVTLADGSAKPIESIERTDLVRGADDKPWQVFNLIGGDDREVIEVTAKDGTVARMTAEHPVITGRDDTGRLRWVTASHVRVGMPLLTTKGDSIVTSVERRPYDGKVYNMVLRPQGSDLTPQLGASFYADGLLVGDQTMQGLAEPAPAAVATARD